MTGAVDNRHQPIGASKTTVTEPNECLRRALVVCDQWLGSNGYAGMKALRRAGWSVHVLPEWEYVPLRWRSPTMRTVGRALRSMAVREFNDEIERQVLRTNPELLLVFKGTFVHAATLDMLRQQRVRSYCFYPDVSFRAHGPYIPGALPHYDWIFTTKSFGLTDLASQLGIKNASLIHHAFDADLHRPVPLTEDDRSRYGCDVSFIGTWSPKKENLLQELHARRPGIRLRIWGEQWTIGSQRAQGLRDVVEGRSVEGEEYVRAIAASAINLAILSEGRLGASAGDQITSRSFHIPACGGLMVHERTDEVLQIFKEPDEIACFGDSDELISQVDRLLSAPTERAEMSRRAYAAVRSRHSWDSRIQEMICHYDATSR